jgi:hypothetical protein
MLNRLLFSHQKPVLIIAGTFGALVGFLLLLGALQLYFDIHAVLTGSSDMNQAQYLVINKEVNLLNTLFGGQKGFSENEIAQLKKIKGVQQAAALTSSRFKVSVSMGEGGMKGMPGMSTDFFFEAVPDNFVDVDADKWQWKEGDPVVPIILPRDYIKLYNFGFAPSQGLPQVTEGLVSLARFNINITGKDGQTITYVGKLAGFSERINTILAPQNFIDFANQKFAGVTPGITTPNRVIIQCEGPATTELVEYFTQNGYETSAESLRNSKLNSFLRIVMSVVILIGSVIILLSLLVFLLYSQLLVSKSSYELQTLIRIGHNYKKLGSKYMKYYSIIYAGIFLFSILVLFISKIYFASYMSGLGFTLPSGLSLTVIFWGFIFTLIFLGVNAYSIFSGLKKLAK